MNFTFGLFGGQLLTHAQNACSLTGALGRFALVGTLGASKTRCMAFKTGLKGGLTANLPQTAHSRRRGINDYMVKPGLRR